MAFGKHVQRFDFIFLAGGGFQVSHPVIGAAFYVSWVLIAVYLLLSLMVTIILDNFEREYMENKKKKAKKKKEKELETGVVISSSFSMKRVVPQDTDPLHENDNSSQVRHVHKPKSSWGRGLSPGVCGWHRE